MTDQARVLYIDDDEGLRFLVRRSLERRGYKVSVAESGVAGVAMAAAEPFDIVAVDHYMPDQDGLETLHQLRRLPNPPPVVYVTGSDESRVAVAALKAGAADYVVKTTGEDFYDLMESAFSQALSQVRLQAAKTLAEEALRETNARLETMLREVNHRVANSLQLVSAFVQMQSVLLSDEAARNALQDTQRRIEAIMQVHRKLYTSDQVEAVEMSSYLATLLHELEDTWSTPEAPRRLILAAETLRLHTDKAVSVGVIVNELVTNACKYAYGPDQGGEVRVSLHWDGPNNLMLRVDDDGVGMQASAAARGTGLGGKIVGAMAGSLKSTIRYESAERGVHACLRVGV